MRRGWTVPQRVGYRSSRRSVKLSNGLLDLWEDEWVTFRWLSPLAELPMNRISYSLSSVEKGTKFSVGLSPMTNPCSTHVSEQKSESSEERILTQKRVREQ
jgi:hypothetical protein